MATLEPPFPQGIYTLSEAIEVMKERDKYPTMSPPIQWIDIKTGKTVSIGYS